MQAGAMIGLADGVQFHKWEQKNYLEFQTETEAMTHGFYTIRQVIQAFQRLCTVGVPTTGTCGHGHFLQCAVQKESSGTRCCRIQRGAGDESGRVLASARRTEQQVGLCRVAEFAFRNRGLICPQRANSARTCPDSVEFGPFPGELQKTVESNTPMSSDQAMAEETQKRNQFCAVTVWVLGGRAIAIARNVRGWELWQQLAVYELLNARLPAPEASYNDRLMTRER